MNTDDITTEATQDENEQVAQRPHRFTWLIGLGVILVIVIIVGISLFASGKTGKEPVTTAINTQSGGAPAEVDITATGFLPATITVKPGQDVEWVNKDANPHLVASDPYPTDNKLPGLNSQQSIASGAMYNYTFEAAGTYTYHDDLNPSLMGIVIVGSNTTKHESK
jgi:plastocyanin